MQISLLNNMLSYLTARRQGAVCPRGAVSQTNLSPARSMLLSAVRAEEARARQGGSNAIHGISMVQAADDALVRMASDLDGALVLAQQAAEGGQGQAELALMQAEFDSLVEGLDAIIASVDFDGTALLTATSEVVLSLARASVDSSTEIRVRTQDMSAEALGLNGVGGEGLALTDSDTVGKLEDAIDEVAALRSDFAVAIRRLWFAGSALESGTDSSLAAESRINGVDITEATAAATSRVILSRGSTALLLQGNVTARAALQLLGLPAVDEPESAFFSLRA